MPDAFPRYQELKYRPKRPQAPRRRKKLTPEEVLQVGRETIAEEPSLAGKVVGGAYDIGKSGFWGLVKTMEAVDAKTWKVVGEHLFGIEDIGTPYEEFSDTAKSLLIAAGADPEGWLARYGSAAVGLAGDIAMSPSTYLGIGLGAKGAKAAKSLKAAKALKAADVALDVAEGVGKLSRAGKAAKVAGTAVKAPFKAIGTGIKVVSYPSELIARVARPGVVAAEKGLQMSGNKALLFLGKERSLAAGVGAVGKGINAAIESGMQKDGFKGAVASSANTVKNGLIRAFSFKYRGGKNVQEALRTKNYIDEMLSWNGNVADALVEGKATNAIYNLAEFMKDGVSYIKHTELADFLDELPVEKLDDIFAEIGSKLGDDINDAVFAIGESKEIDKILASYKLSDDAKDLAKAYINTNREILNQSLREAQRIDLILDSDLQKLSKGKNRKALVDYFLAKPYVDDLHEAKIYAEKALKQGINGVMKQFDSLAKTKQPLTTLDLAGLSGVQGALTSSRVEYLPHIYSKKARDIMYQKGLWDKWGEALETLLAQDKTAAGSQVRNIIADSVDEVRRRGKVTGEWGRLPIAQHMTAKELNKAAWMAGLPQDIKLVDTHIGRAVGKKVSQRAADIALGHSLRDIASEAKSLPEMQKATKELSEYLKPEKVFQHSTEIASDVKNVRRGRTALEGYVTMQNPSDGKWFLLPEDYAAAAINSQKLFKPEEVGKFAKSVLKSYDAVHGKLASLALNYNPGRVFRDMVDDPIRLSVEIGAHYALKGLDAAADMLQGKNIIMRFSDGAKTLTPAQIDNLLAKGGKTGGLYKVTREGAEQSGKIGFLGRGFGDVAEFMENQRARAGLLGALEKYKHLPFDEAYAKAMEHVRGALFAYNEIAPFEKSIARRTMFFYRFIRHNLYNQLRMAVENPYRQWLTIKVPGKLFGQPMTEEEEAVMPEWVAERGGYKTGRSGDIVEFAPGFGLSQYSALSLMSPSTAFQEFLSGMAPIPRVFLEAVSGKQFHSWQDISKNRRIYSPAIAKALKIADPLFKVLGKSGMAEEAENKNGQKYWIVPGWAIWTLSQFRPLNDLKKLLDNRSGFGEKAIWFATGQRGYEVDVPEAYQWHLTEQIQDMMEPLLKSGELKEFAIKYQNKDIVTSEEREDDVSRFMKAFRRMEKIGNAKR